jgi:potassium efflux system protein
MTLPVPALLWLLAWRLREAGGTNPNSEALAAALQAVATNLFMLYGIYQICAPKGIAEAYFGWPADRLRILTRNLKWFIPVLIVSVLGIMTAARLFLSQRFEAQGRPMFLIAMVALSALLFRVLKPAKGAMTPWLAVKAGSFAQRMRYPVYAALVATPLVLAGTAAVGYYYTALRLSGCFFRTLLVLFWAIVFESLAAEWIALAQRKLTLIDARRRFAALTAEERESMAGAQPAEEAVDVSAISRQVRRLLSLAVILGTLVTLHAVWVEVLPAFGVFDKVQLWSQTVKVTETVAAPDGTQRTSTIDKTMPVTLGSLLWALAALALTISAVRNIPGLVELMVLQRLPLDSGLRYALTTVIRYLIVIVGGVIVCGLVGIGWSSVQWLAAAVTVGLGFGLQEIFANFVSGLILLFERPLRVGDTVSIGDIHGTVTQIRIRGTTIRTWDGKDLIVPNKSLITGNLLNWTLTDSMSRLEFTVAPDYGTDPAEVRRILLEIAAQDSRVLREPEPAVTFSAFGAAALEFRLSVFVNAVTERGPVTNDINTEIARRFAEAGIGVQGKKL